MDDKRKTEVILYLIAFGQIIIYGFFCFGRALLVGHRKTKNLLGALIIILIGLIIFVAWMLTYVNNIKLLPR